MKTTLEIPGPILRKAKSAAALRGQTLKQFVTEAMAEKLNAASETKGSQPWMKYFGLFKGHSAETRKIDAIIEEEFGRIDPEEWK
ncbi:MAG TPA: hypothetical protein VG733_11040 [Chthoniobacteraceae bacterium]|nr:hypothetical protein [Chthoniobacteraceae bacterium]